MAKKNTIYVCQECGGNASKWQGKCPHCEAWNTLVEEKLPAGGTKALLAGLGPAKPQAISDIAGELVLRIPSTIKELDSVLGGGLVPGSVVLIGGEPGTGKSTLLLQAGALYAKTQRVLYVSGEESPSQIALRANRLGISEKELYVVSETSLENVKTTIENLKPQLLILDSVQTIYSQELESQPGSVAQLRECSHEIITLAKALSMATFLVGHVTKEGAIAGPKILEHMVDVVLYFEGTSIHTFRLLRSIKNRFGSTNELGVFEMTGKGMKEVNNPSELFLSERATSIPGSTIVASLEGSRPILVEVQALVSSSTLAMPRRTAIGIDHNRLALLTAILEKRCGYRLGDQDVYVNIAGGLRLTEPAVDLGLISAIISSFSGKAVPKEVIFFGEVGLGGEVRAVPRAEDRLKEARRVGFSKAFLPKRGIQELQMEGISLVPIEQIGQLTDYF